MGKRDEARFDAFRLSAEGGEMAGQLDPASLPRLADEVEPGRGEVFWRIRGIRDPLGRPAIAVELSGHVALECQRCLGTVELPVEQRTELLLAHDEQELVRLDADSELEVALAGERLDARMLVEDELLLTLPYAPRHEGTCPAAPEGAADA
jgi:uncharacterized protein